MRGGEGVKPEYVLVAVVTACLTVMSVTPALAAPRQIEEFCFEQARRYVTGDPYRRGACEAAIANCIADLTPTLKAQVSRLTQVLRGVERQRDPQAEGEGA